MDMKKTLISLLTAGLFGVMSQGALAAPELVDKVLAVVNKDVVLASQQEALVQKVKASAQESGQSLPDDVTLRKQALDRLIQERVLNPDRVIGGMLHPSGNCTYRINYLIGDRSAPVPHATNPVPYDQGRRAFRERFVTA